MAYEDSFLEVTTRENGRRRVRTMNNEESKTVQSDVHEAEIHEILGRYAKTGILPHMSSVDLQFRDVSQFEDYADMARQNKEAEAIFMQLPSKVREIFEHDHYKWLDAAEDPEKLEALRPKLEKLGLWKEDESVAESVAASSAGSMSADAGSGSTGAGNSGDSSSSGQ